MVPRSHRTQPHSSLQQDVEKPYFLKEHYTTAPPASRSDQPQTIISLEQHSTPLSQGVGDTGLTARLRWGAAQGSIIVPTQGAHAHTQLKTLKSSQERKSWLLDRGKSTSWVENWSQPIKSTGTWELLRSWWSKEENLGSKMLSCK